MWGCLDGAIGYGFGSSNCAITRSALVSVGLWLAVWCCCVGLRAGFGGFMLVVVLVMFVVWGLFFGVGCSCGW